MNMFVKYDLFQHCNALMEFIHCIDNIQTQFVANNHHKTFMIKAIIRVTSAPLSIRAWAILVHWGYLRQKHTVWREGGEGLFLYQINRSHHHIWYSSNCTSQAQILLYQTDILIQDTFSANCMKRAFLDASLAPLAPTSASCSTSSQ